MEKEETEQREGLAGAPGILGMGSHPVEPWGALEKGQVWSMRGIISGLTLERENTHLTNVS